MVFVNQIQSIVSKYDFDWFLSMKNQFKDDTWYDKKQDTIIIEYTDSQINYNLSILKTVIDEESVTFSSYTLEEFCWSYTNRHFSKEEYESKFNDGSFFVHACSEIISITKELLNQVGSIDEKDKLITSIINLIVKEFEKLSIKKDDEYENLLSFFIQKVRTEFGRHFISIKDINGFIKEYQDKLEFNLNQEELAVLLSVLIDADVLKVGLDGTKNIRTFAERFFYITHGKTKNQQPAKNISTKMNDYINHVITPSTIVKVKKQLLKVLK